MIHYVVNCSHLNEGTSRVLTDRLLSGLVEVVRTVPSSTASSLPPPVGVRGHWLDSEDSAL